VRTDKEVLKECHRWGEPISKIEGKIKEFEITGDGVCLVFRVGYLFKSGKGKESPIRIDAFNLNHELHESSCISLFSLSYI